MIFLNYPVYQQDLVHSTTVKNWLSRVWWWAIDWIDLPSLKLFKTGKKAFHKVQSLTLSSVMIDDWMDLPKLNELKIEDESFFHTSSLTLNSRLLILLMIKVFLPSPVSQWERNAFYMWMILLLRVSVILITLLDLPKLGKLLFGNYSFFYTKSLVIRGMIDSCFITWSS